MRHSSWI